MGMSFVLNLVIATSLAMFIGGGKLAVRLVRRFMSGFTFVAWRLASSICSSLVR